MGVPDPSSLDPRLTDHEIESGRSSCVDHDRLRRQWTPEHLRRPVAGPREYTGDRPPEPTIGASGKEYYTVNLRGSCSLTPSPPSLQPPLSSHRGRTLDQNTQHERVKTVYVILVKYFRSGLCSEVENFPLHNYTKTTQGWV